MPAWAWWTFAGWVAFSVLVARFIGRAFTLGSRRDDHDKETRR